MIKNSLKQIATSLVIVFIAVTAAYFKLLALCNAKECVVLGGDTITQILNYVKLRIPELWIAEANYGINPSTPSPGVVIYALIIKFFYFVTNNSMVLTFYLILLLFFWIGSVGLVRYLVELFNDSDNTVFNLAIALLIYVLNPGIWVSLHHGIMDFLVSYSMISWAIFALYRMRSCFLEGAIKKRSSAIVIIRYPVILALLSLLSLVHVVGFAITATLIIMYFLFTIIHDLLFTRKLGLKITIRYLLVIVLALIITLLLLLPYYLVLQSFTMKLAPSNNYNELIKYSHRTPFVISWRSSTLLEAFATTKTRYLPFSTNTLLALTTISGMILFASIILLSKIPRNTTRIRDEILVWIVIFLVSVTLSLGTQAPFPLNVINLWMWTYNPLLVIVGGPFRMSENTGFSLVILTYFVLNYFTKRRKQLNFSNKLEKVNLLRLTAIFMVISLFILPVISELITSRKALTLKQDYYLVTDYIKETLNRGNGIKQSTIYIIPSTGWVIPYKLIEVDKETPSPHNLLGYVLALNGVPETRGGYLKPYFEYVIRHNLTDLLSILMHYMNIKYVAVDGYVKPPIPWLRGETNVIARQVGVEPLAEFGDIKLFKVNVGGETEVQKGFLKVYKHYIIVATNLLKFLPVVLVDRDILDAYPVVVDEISLPIISDILDNAYAVVIDRAGFYDLVLSELIRNSNTILFNPFELLDKGSCVGRCSIDVMRVGWGYIGKPYYSLYDGVLHLKSNSIYMLDLNVPKGKGYVVMVRVLVRGHSGFIKVNSHKKEMATEIREVSFYEPIWLIFPIKESEVKISVNASKDVYLDCIVIAPLEEHYKALNETISKLRRTTTYMVLMPYNLQAEYTKKINILGLGVIAQGNLALDNSASLISGDDNRLYIIGNKDMIVLSSLNLTSEKSFFERYKILSYHLLRDENSHNLTFFAPYVKGFNYVLLLDGTIKLKGFAEYLWSIPLNYFSRDSKYGLLCFSFMIDPISYAPDIAFGIALFHNTTYGYEVKFTIKSWTEDKIIYVASLIKRINNKPVFLQSQEIVLRHRNHYHMVNVYMNLQSKAVLVIIDDVPAMSFYVSEIYGNLFGIVQWGKDAEATIERAQMLYPVTTYKSQVHNIVYKYLNSNSSIVGYSLKLDLLKIKPNNGIAIIFIKSALPKKTNTESLSTLVLLQSYRPAWKVSLPRSQNISLLHHIRGLYGISNIYLVNASSCSITELLKNVDFYLASTRFVITSLGIFTTYVLLYIVIIILSLVRHYSKRLPIRHSDR